MTLSVSSSNIFSTPQLLIYLEFSGVFAKCSFVSIQSIRKTDFEFSPDFRWDRREGDATIWNLIKSRLIKAQHSIATLFATNM